MLGRPDTGPERRRSVIELIVRSRRVIQIRDAETLCPASAGSGTRLRGRRLSHPDPGRIASGHPENVQ